MNQFLLVTINLSVIFNCVLSATAATAHGVGTISLPGYDKGVTYYLNGEGRFNPSNLAKWQVDKISEDVSFSSVQVNGMDALKMTKSVNASLSFLDYHLSYKLPSSIKPVHLMFSFYSSNVETEDTNLRLLNESLNKTVVLFRCGNAGFVRVNDNQMIDFYNSTIESKADISIPTWTRVNQNTANYSFQSHLYQKCDIFLDWDAQSVKVYLNSTFKAEANFYINDVPTIDTVRVYNLKPNTLGYFQDIKLCEAPSCDGFLKGFLLQTISFFLIALTVFSL